MMRHIAADPWFNSGLAKTLFIFQTINLTFTGAYTARPKHAKGLLNQLIQSSVIVGIEVDRIHFKFQYTNHKLQTISNSKITIFKYGIHFLLFWSFGFVICL